MVHTSVFKLLSNKESPPKNALSYQRVFHFYSFDFLFQILC